MDPSWDRIHHKTLQLLGTPDRSALELHVVLFHEADAFEAELKKCRREFGWSRHLYGWVVVIYGDLWCLMVKETIRSGIQDYRVIQCYIETITVQHVRWRFCCQAEKTTVRRGDVVLNILLGMITFILTIIKHHLVGGWATPLKNMSSVSWGYYSYLFLIYMERHKIPWFQSPPTSHRLRKIYPDQSSWESDGLSLPGLPSVPTLPWYRGEVGWK